MEHVCILLIKDLLNLILKYFITRTINESYLFELLGSYRLNSPFFGVIGVIWGGGISKFGDIMCWDMIGNYGRDSSN
jgi:hypothetical protein